MEGTMKRVSVGVFYQAYGRITVEVPDEVGENDIREYLEEHRDEYPLPSDASYVQDSDEIDPCSIEFVNE
jgi:hypothetical protein